MKIMAIGAVYYAVAIALAVVAWATNGEGKQLGDKDMTRKVMEVLTAKDGQGAELTLAQIRADWHDLKAAHERALKAEPTWAMFGGILIVNGHEYQVV